MGFQPRAMRSLVSNKKSQDFQKSRTCCRALSKIVRQQETSAASLSVSRSQLGTIPNPNVQTHVHKQALIGAYGYVGNTLPIVCVRMKRCRGINSLYRGGANLTTAASFNRQDLNAGGWKLRLLPERLSSRACARA